MTDLSAPAILLVDDEPTLREPLAEYLTGQGFVVTEAESAAQARARLDEQGFALALVDIMMPGEDGLSLCRHLIEARDLPTILLTARGEATDRIVGLEIGADDYVTKPFEPRELVARIRSVLRRATRAPGDDTDETCAYHFDGWTLDPTRQRLIDPEGVLVDITGADFRLLKALLDHPGQVLDRDRLLDFVQGREQHMFDRAVDNQVSRLRRKMARNGDEQLIQTIRGGGYRLAAEVRRVECEA
ncbi:MAG: DNA-binding response regulator [Sphingomonadales bacterium CG12_big_fil_rev_8_21_14_0_65_65_10]|jgi:two-component system, OmpR family, response regulator|uniref:DNA-binding response regulator n=1 Tax=Blastomonas marina TaxID=1867408 RepID=A0ABQ1F1E9_9SPHN|nr:response regulator transcription factor [Blastomonas marina]PIW54053.1 MAG: DNA-binding response regulator [Sphingomonadales bacterium CG12_big_fil_rev_8_21_14_0_65_65_10]WPZ03627.1 response regulator transcription factor [Blastomonas marina]GFZ96424.1 DNA-binding response regulator [Blastomonas marina]